PFTDVGSSPFFCQIAEAFFSGLTSGTSATTYSPGNVVTREQMAAFVTRTQDSALRRGSRRAALNQWWTPSPLGLGPDSPSSYTAINMPAPGQMVQSDGADIWVASGPNLNRVSASS